VLLGRRKWLAHVYLQHGKTCIYGWQEIIMPISIRDPRVGELARKLAKQRKTTMTAVILQALQRESAHSLKTSLLRSKIDKIVNDLKANAKPGGRRMTKGEIDRMWGHE
jgi:hypothetical protein